MPPLPLALLLSLALSACAGLDRPAAAPQSSAEAPADPVAASLPSLTLAWQVTGFSAPEGVARAGDTVFISNVAGEGDAKDGEGWISRLSMDGTVHDQRWVDGFNAPKGMAVRDGVLFVADIDAYHTIDVASGTRLNTISVPEAGFLNDVVVWNGDVFASDSASGTIFQLDENGYKTWLSEAELQGPNGLLAQGDELLVATMGGGGQLLAIGPDGTVETLATGMENADGLAALDDGSYLVSSWPGEIWHVRPYGEVYSLLDTRADGIFQNDLTRYGDLIIVPNWQPGTVTAWRVDP